MTKPPTMPDIRILTRSISEEWEDLLLGAYTDPERVETDRLRYLAAVGVQDPWQERRDDGDLENAVKITAVPYHGDAPAETLHIVMLYEECLGQTAKTMLAAFLPNNRRSNTAIGLKRTTKNHCGLPIAPSPPLLQTA